MFKYVLLTTLFASFALAQEDLEVISTNVKLPFGRHLMTTAYNGVDSIYLFGGVHAEGETRQIIRYSFSNNTLIAFGEMERDLSAGSGIIASDGIMYYFGGRNTSGDTYSEIFKIFEDGSVVEINSLPGNEGRALTQAVTDGGDNIYIVGGQDGSGSVLTTLSKYAISENTIQDVAPLPAPRIYASTDYDRDSESVFIFGGFDGASSLRDILKFNSVEGSVETLTSTLPQPLQQACAVSTGNAVYIIGGVESEGLDNFNPVLRFDRLTGEITIVNVSNFPSQLRGSGCVYVESLNRIYILGGRVNEDYQVDVLYIDLN